MTFLHRVFPLLALAYFCTAFQTLAAIPANAPDFIAFESMPVRPIARHDNKLLVTNIPNNSLSIFEIGTNGQLGKESVVPVGMEPVSVTVHAEGNTAEAWVVNHLSDSISIIDLTKPHFPVIRTLLVGDEPRDIVKANGKMFITTARRGQHRNHESLRNVPGAGEAKLFTASIPRADIWVFDARDQGDALGGTPLKIIELFGDTPRPLAVSPDGKTIYAGIFNSGNQTTTITESALCSGFDDYGFAEAWLGTEPCQVMDEITVPNGLPDGELPGGRPGPGKNAAGEYQPWTGMIVKFDRKSGEWRDIKGRNFSNAVRFFLPDRDVFAIDTDNLTEKANYAHAGTTLFNMAVHPKTGNVYVSNTDAQNHVRFEGSGKHGGSTVQGNLARAQITVINPQSGAVMPRHLNRHIDYSVLKAPPSVKQHSVAQPTQLQISKDGRTLYAVSASSGKIAVYETADLDNPRLWRKGAIGFDPRKASSRHIPVENGPMGLLLDEAQNQAFVLTRYNNSVAVIDLAQQRVRQSRAMHNPEPKSVTDGRFMLYDARIGSSNGEASCASCHIGGDMDHLAWNLGNPDAANTVNPQPFPTIRFAGMACEYGTSFDEACQISKLINGNGDLQTFASMKGPMTTQTMRGMSTHGHMHWRGDRANGYFGVDHAQKLDEKTSFKNFIVAFEGLQGVDIHIPESVKSRNKSAAVKELEANMDLFADFMLSVQLPPNPIRNLDNSHSKRGRVGQAFFHGDRLAVGLPPEEHRPSWWPDLGPDSTGLPCRGCHEHNPAKGFYGANGEASHGGELQVFKTPHFRNLYQKVGMFGMPYHYGYRPTLTNRHQGEQIRGFGFLHDGATDLLFNFLGGRVFDNGDVSCDDENLDEDHGCDFNYNHVGIPDDQVRQGLVDYLMEFDSDLAPIVGQQITLSAKMSSPAILQRIALLQERATAPFTSKILGGNTLECELVVHAVIDGTRKNWLYSAVTSQYQGQNNQLISPGALMQLGRQGENSLTFTCAPPGSGRHMAFAWY